MFGELVGAWLADLWDRAGRPETAYVELGPGRGTLAADALRVMAKAGLTPPVHLVETSPVLRQAQAQRVPNATWHEDFSTLPRVGPLLVVANEFFDALPICQFDHDGGDIMVETEGDHFVRRGDVAYEVAVSSEAMIADLALRLGKQAGALLIIDYGYVGDSGGDTLQAVSRHVFADPWHDPGSRDLTAHVGFSKLAEVAIRAGARVSGPIGQGPWLEALGVGARAVSLRDAAPDRASEIEAARARLTASDQMGDLFKVMAVTAPSWPVPAGFAA